MIIIVSLSLWDCFSFSETNSEEDEEEEKDEDDDEEKGKEDELSEELSEEEVEEKNVNGGAKGDGEDDEEESVDEEDGDGEGKDDDRGSASEPEIPLKAAPAKSKAAAVKPNFDDLSSSEVTYCEWLLLSNCKSISMLDRHGWSIIDIG